MKQFLEITDMPTDKYGTLGQLRTLLVKAYNRCRESKEAMTLLKVTLKFVYNKCLEHEKKGEETAEAALREQTLLAAHREGYDLDERLSTENLVVELTDLRAKKASEIADLPPETASKTVADKTETAKS